MSLEQAIREHLDWQEKCGWHHDWPEALDALRAVLDAHSPRDGEDRCPVCVYSWGDEETQTSPRATVTALAAALGMTE